MGNKISTVLKNSRPVKLYKKVREIFTICKGCPINFFACLFLAVRAYLKGGFNPKEMATFGLLDPKSSKQNLAKYCSKRNMLKIQASLNPQAWQNITADKGIFYKYCQALNIPIPNLYGIFFKHSAGWSFQGSVLNAKHDWIHFFNSEIPSEFVIKPAAGAYGACVKICVRAEDGFFGASGDRFRASDLYESLQSDRIYDAFVIQERLKSHPDIISFSGSENLQTVRIITLIDRSGNFQILYAFFKSIVGENVIDNFDSGRKGNLIAEVVLDTGVLKSAMTVSPDGSGPKVITRHTITGTYFEGFQLPLWKEACSLAREAAFKFLPKRTIGWDVALTPNGVYILEANGRYDPPLTHPRIKEFLSRLY